MNKPLVTWDFSEHIIVKWAAEEPHTVVFNVQHGNSDIDEEVAVSRLRELIRQIDQYRDIHKDPEPEEEA